MNKKIFILLLIIFLQTGCWNYQELNSLAITTAIAIDNYDNGYEVSILIANVQNKQSGTEEGESKTTVYSASGKTLSDALKNIDLKSPRQTYIGHLSSLIISEDIAKNNLLNVLDLLLRDSESTKRFYIAVANKNKAKDILKIMSPLETFPSQTISKNIGTSSESQAISTSITYSEFISNILKKGIDPILPTISVEGEIKDGSKSSNLEKSEPDASIILGPIAIFKDNKLINYASKMESRGINLATNKINEMIIVYNCESDNYLVTKISDIKSKRDVKIDNDNIRGIININASGKIVENNCKININNKEDIDKIKSYTEKQIKKIINSGINFSKDNLVDPYGFGNILYKKDPKLFNYIENWNDYFKNMDIKVNVNANIITKGSANKTIKEALNEN